MNVLISVIIPVYNVEKYLNRCINSIVSQTYKNLEIILVDDGSPDRCGKMCDEWAKKDERIKVIHKTNGGLSEARNHGVLNSNGKYISFVDSDDYVSLNYISYLYDLMMKYNSDISCCNYFNTFSGTEDFKIQPTEDINVFNNIESVKALHGSFYVQLVTACGKLYKSELVKRNLFPVGRLHEDEATAYKYYYNSQKTVVSNCELYAYFQNESSITHNKTERNIADISISYEEKIKYFHSKNEIQLVNLALEQYVEFLIHNAVKKSELSKKKLKAVSLSMYLSQDIRLACKLNLIGWIIFKKDLYSMYYKLYKMIHH